MRKAPAFIKTGKLQVNFHGSRFTAWGRRETDLIRLPAAPVLLCLPETFYFPGNSYFQGFFYLQGNSYFQGFFYLQGNFYFPAPCP